MTGGEPLSLESPRWSELEHACGPATDIPAQLSQIYAFPERNGETDEGPWHSLWSAIAHQGDVFTASYAAPEHLALDGAKRPASLWLHRMQFVAELSDYLDHFPDGPNAD